MTDSMLNPTALDWTVEIGALGIAGVLLVWSLIRPRRPSSRDRQDDES